MSDRNTRIDSSQVSPLKPSDISGQRNPVSGQTIKYIGTDDFFEWTEFIDGDEFILDSQNIAIGIDSGRNLSTGDYNTILGYNAGYELETGEKNTLIGQSSGYNNDGDRNTFVGQLSGYYNLGNDNLYIGHESGYNNTSGNKNTFIGTYAGNGNTIENQNIYIGYASGYNAESEKNVYIGTYAGYSQGSGNRNSYIGYSSGYVNGGKNNCFIGYQSGYNSNENFNTFIGYRAGVGNISGSGNTSLGYNAGAWATNSLSKNIYIGFKAGMYNTVENRLFINASDSEYPLIYGKLDDREILIGDDVSHFFLRIYEDTGDSIIESPPSGNNIFLNPIGDGKVKFGSYSSKDTESFSGYIEILDENGNSRKLMVCD